ncbi:MAG: hypothetical protein AAF558_08885 [Verrucomicrobiota bacterium]
MKSAYERAMEKLGGESTTPRLNDAQKQEINELNQKYEAQIAERKTFLQSKISEALASGNSQEVEELDSQLTRDVAAIQDEWQTKKDKIWKQA